jgi:ABC-type multidrug transport system ATPase subunit
LHDVNLQVAAGERLLLLGPNGAGKSTFIRVFAGLMAPTHGAARVLDAPARSSVARASVGVVSHTTYLYEELTALENLRLYAELYDVPRPRQRGEELLERVGLADLAATYVGRLSRGQQQRVTIARALLHDPRLLLLDEPDTGLDVAAWLLLEQLAGEGSRAVVITTHNIASGIRVATRVAVLSHGGVVHQLPSAPSAAEAGELVAMLERLAHA